MHGTTLTPRRVLCGLGIAAAAAVAACSGGGSSAPAPSPGPPLGGIGASVALNARVNFTVIVPPLATSSAVAAARRKRSPNAVTNTNPYVSPKTGSVSLQIATVNGQSPRTLPAPLFVNIACATTSGCSVPIQNVPAANGVDRFAVQTFSGTGGSGNIISSGFVDVTVPSAQAVSFGGTALTIGGFVASISLALTIPGGTFTWHAPAAGTLDVNAVDPAGAIIIGSDQLANPIAVALPDTDAGAFALNGAAQLSLQQPAQSIALAYNGTVLFGGTVTASTTDENSQPVATSIPIPLQAPPTPTPSPVAANKPPLSLYVYDSAADRIIEYAGVNGVEGGQPLSPTPRRIFEVAPPPALVPNVDSNCNPVGGNGPVLADMAIDASGTIYAQTTCADAATTSLQYVLSYAASTQEAVPAQGAPTPPPPTSTFTVATTPGQSAFTQGIALDEVHGTLYLGYSPTASAGAVFGGDNVIGVSIANTANVTTNFGSYCLQQIGSTTACTIDSTTAYGVSPYNLAVDANGNIYVPQAYTQTDSNGGTITPPGPVSQAVSGEPTILAFSPNLMGQAPPPMSALAGLSDELGTVNASPTNVAVEGSTLYVLANPGTTTDPSTGNTLNAGLSGCPPPSSNAIPDTVALPNTPTTCEAAGPGYSEYIAGFPAATTSLAGSGNAGTNVIAPPAFMLGGDVVGGFGAPNSVAGLGGKQFTVRDGFAYVLNVDPPPFTGLPAEVDIYNLNNVTGFHTDIAPVTRLILNAPITPTTIAIGATGTGIGGQALLRRPARVHHDVKAWLRMLQQRRRHRVR